MGELFFSSWGPGRGGVSAGLGEGGWRGEGPSHLQRWTVLWGETAFFGAQTPFSRSQPPFSQPEMLPSHRCCNYLQLLPREKGLYLLKGGEMKVGLKVWVRGGGWEGKWHFSPVIRCKQE